MSKNKKVKEIKNIISIMGLIILVLNFTVGTIVLAFPVYSSMEYVITYLIGLLMYSIPKYGISELL